MFSLSLLFFGMGTGGVLVVLTSRVTHLYEGKSAGLAQAAFFGAYTLGAAVGLVTGEPIAVSLGGWRVVSGLWAALSAISLIPALRSSLPLAVGKAPAARVDQLVPGSTRRVLLYAFVYAAYVGGYLGLVGFLPYQLREWGWESVAADAALATSTLGFIAGSFLWATLTDRYGRRGLVFSACMMAMAILTVLVPALAVGEAPPIAAIAIAGVGFFGGAMSLFFPIISEDPRIGEEQATQAIGITTAASYAGGFVIPFSAAPFTDAFPVSVIAAFGAAFAFAGVAMLIAEGRNSD